MGSVGGTERLHFHPQVERPSTEEIRSQPIAKPLEVMIAFKRTGCEKVLGDLFFAHGNSLGYDAGYMRATVRLPFMSAVMLTH